MLKVIVKEPGKIVYEDVPIPEPGDGEALIRVKSVGLCYSDVAPYKGRHLDILPLPMVQGHEFGGIIEKINGDSKTFKAGDQVVVYPMTECGGCYYCRHGLGLLCENQVMFGSPAKEGGMAEKVIVPVSQLIKMDDGFDIRYAGIVEPATVAYRAVAGFRDSNVLIIGTGAIGMIMMQICKMNSNRVIAMDISDEALDSARELGADLAVNVKDQERKVKINDYLGNEKVDVVVLAFINQENLDFALDIIRKEGSIVYMSLPEKLVIDFAPFFFKALKLTGTISYNMDMFRATADLVQTGKINYKKLVTKMFPLNLAKEAFDYKGNFPALKIILAD